MNTILAACMTFNVLLPTNGTTGDIKPHPGNVITQMRLNTVSPPHSENVFHQLTWVECPLKPHKK